MPDLILVRQGQDPPAGWPREALREASPHVLERISQAATSSGYLARFQLPTPPPLAVDAGGLILAGIADPGNLGSLLRSAAAFAVRQVALIACADPYAPKTVQATAGAAASVAIHRFGEEDGLAAFAVPGAAPLCALVVDGGAKPEALPPLSRWLVIGSEAHGIHPAWLAACRERMTLRMPGMAESLNAAVAGGIAMYLLARRV